jgi:hypothetical protein
MKNATVFREGGAEKSKRIAPLPRWETAAACYQEPLPSGVNLFAVPQARRRAAAIALQDMLPEWKKTALGKISKVPNEGWCVRRLFFQQLFEPAVRGHLCCVVCECGHQHVLCGRPFRQLQHRRIRQREVVLSRCKKDDPAVRSRTILRV